MKKATVKKKPVEKKMTEKEILKQLNDPKLSKAKRDKLMDKLYEGIEIRGK